MSAATKTVSFKARDKKKGNVSIEDIPHSNAPNAVSMLAGDKGTERTDATLKGTALRSNTAVDEQFPTEALTQEDPRDVLMAQKQELQDQSERAGKPGITPFGQLIASDEDFKWLQGKREAEAEANFQQWFATNFDKMSPEQKAVARELFPSFYSQRLSALENRVNLARRIAKLKLEGIKNKDDLLLQYAIEAGFIDSDPLESILHPERSVHSQDKTDRQKMFARGLLNPRRLIRGDWGTRKREENAAQLLGRTNIGDAYKLGTGDFGFSAAGTVNADQERDSSNYVGTLGLVKP